MSEISLRDYADELKRLIEQNQAREVIPLAQYLLRRHPRYLEGYRLLGEAALMQGHFRDAIEIFRRVLSVDPEDYVAHAGIAVAYSEDGDMDEALWHMMRAFEMKPDIKEVREQIRELYAMRDGRAPGRLHLNRAALARLYVRDGWYHKAAEELRNEAEDEADRVDLLAGLAEAHWQAGNRQDAINVAHDVLMELPYCLKCNLFIGELYAQQGDLASADRYLRIAQELDPENEVAVALFGPTGYLQPNYITIPSIDEVRQDTSYITGMREEPLPEWLADLSLFTTPELENEYVDWDAIIAYETNWRTILRKATEEAVVNFKTNWEIELRRATYLALKQRGEAVVPPRPLGRPSRERALPAEPERTSPIEIFDWRWVMRMAMLEEMDQADWRVRLRAATREALTPSDWRALLRMKTRLALGEEVDWRETMRIATLLALAGSPDWRSTLREATARSLAGEEAWPPTLRTATERALREPPGWQAALRQATTAALQAPSWQRALRQATIDELEQPAWVKALRQASTTVLEPTVAPWVEALRTETEARLTEVTEPEPGIVGQLVEGVREAAHRVQEVADTLRHKATDTLGSLIYAISPGTERPEQLPWAAQLRTATGSALSEIPGEEAPSLPTRLIEGAEEALHRAQETGKAITGKARGALTSFLRKPVDEETPPEPLSLEEAAEFWSDVTEEHVQSSVEEAEQEAAIQEVPLEIEMPSTSEVPVMSARTADLELPPVETLDEWIEGVDEFWNEVAVDLMTESAQPPLVAKEPEVQRPETLPEPGEPSPGELSEPLAPPEEGNWLAEMADEFWSDVAVDLGGGQPPAQARQEAPPAETPVVTEPEPEAAEPAQVEETLETGMLELPPAEELAGLMDSANEFWSDVSLDLTGQPAPEPELGAAELAARQQLETPPAQVEAELTAAPVEAEAPPPAVEAAEPLGTTLMELPPAEELAGLMDAADDFWSDVSLDLTGQPAPEPELGAAELAARQQPETPPAQVEAELTAAPVEAEAPPPAEAAEPLGTTLLELPPAEELAGLMDAADDFWSDVSLDLTPPPTSEAEGVQPPQEEIVETEPQPSGPPIQVELDLEDSDVLLPSAEGSQWETEAEGYWSEVAVEATPLEPQTVESADPLRRAAGLWQRGEREEALTLYHDLFHERSVEDQALSAALAEHIAAGDAPGGAYQILGDLYRRMGRMQEAVVQYREAIKRKK